MKATVVIPVWNGAAVIEDCLTAVYQHRSPHLQAVICVDNGSQDHSRRLIEAKFPQATLLPQPVNLGFAAGVNVGLRAASGDLFVLLNQDCVVQSGWLDALCEAVEKNPSLGIVGGRILNADQTVNHAGAYLQRPLAYGRHITTEEQSDKIEYVTGAMFGITRQAWQTVGEFDEGFYPAYYEETDYCFRARKLGFAIGYVPEATAVHLFNNKAWQTNPVQHSGNQHAMRYRFIAKQYSLADLEPFFPAETEAINKEIYYEQAIGRFLGIRQLLQNLPTVLEARNADLHSQRPANEVRLLTARFTKLLHHAQDASIKTSLQRQPEPPTLTDELWQNVQQRLNSLQQQEHDLLARIYFIAPGETDGEPGWKRLWRLFVLRPLSFIIGRDYYLLSQLNTIHVARLDQMNKLNRLIERRLTVLDSITRYEHR
jgi:GT2 family glycosyltransferase